jgi:arginase
VSWALLGAPLDSSGEGRGEELAPRVLRDAGLAERLGLEDRGDVTGVLRDPRRDPDTGVIAAAQLATATAALRDTVAATLERGERPFVLGGDCSLLPGALEGAVAARGPTSLWMVDGHPDALDGESSPTGEAADMDLTMVVERGTVDPGDVALIGHRPASLGAEVADEIARVPPAVTQVEAPELRRRGASAVAARLLEVAAGGPAWLHLDLDVLDESEFPAVSYPQPEGLRWEELIELVTPLLAAPNLAGMSLADLDAAHEQAARHAAATVEALVRAWP